MSAKALKLLNSLREDLELTDLPDFAKRVEAIGKLLTPAPRKTKSLISLKKFKLIVTEGVKDYEVFIDGEKELDKWLTLKNKTHKAKVDMWLGEQPYPRKLTKPSELYGRGRPSERQSERENYERQLTEAGLNLNVSIQAL